MYNDALDGRTLSEVVSEIESDPNYIKYDDLPQNYINAVIAVEDHRYRDHGAIDFIAIGRAIYINITNFELREGGSTITQQVAKNIFYIEETNPVTRKIAEIITAFDLEKNFSKDKILELYVNTIYFGDGYYGIEEACQGYLGKSTTEMTLEDCTMMAGIPNAPSVYAPTVNPDLTRSRQEKVISEMNNNGYLSEEDTQTLLNNLDKYYEDFD
jgi:membrane peptidoglycan carboxypeptidase